MEFKRKHVIPLMHPHTGLHHIYIGYYWALTDKDEIISSSSSYQCNKQKEVLENLLHIYPKNTRIDYIPAVYIPVNASDYVQ